MNVPVEVKVIEQNIKTNWISWTAGVIILTEEKLTELVIGKA